MLQTPTDWFQGLRPWRVQGRALALLPFPGFSGPETDMRSLRTDSEHAGASAATADPAVRGNAGQQWPVWGTSVGGGMRGWGERSDHWHSFLWKVEDEYDRWLGNVMISFLHDPYG